MKLNRAELNSLLTYGITLTRDRDDAMELMQACVTSFLETRPRGVQQPLSYLRRMMRNRFIDNQRWAVRHPDVAYVDEVHSPTIERELEDLLVDEIAIETVWQKMTADEREIVHFWAIEGMTAAEIALHLGISRNTVLSRLHRVRQRLLRFHPEKCNQKRI